MTIVPTQADIDRFLSRVTVVDNGCWHRTGAHTGSGYVNFYCQGRYIGGHIFSWMVRYGTPPEGTEFDHVVCHDKGCVNPDHVEPVAIAGRENTKRYYADHRAITTCPAGHERTPENTYVQCRKDGRICRACRPCRTAAAQASHERAGRR